MLESLNKHEKNFLEPTLSSFIMKPLKIAVENSDKSLVSPPLPHN